MSTKPFEPVVPKSVDQINLLNHGTQNCPYHAYSLLRDQAPVWRDPITGFYVVTRFEDVRPLLLDPQNFVNSMQGGGRAAVVTKWMRSARGACWRSTKRKAGYRRRRWPVATIPTTSACAIC